MTWPRNIEQWRQFVVWESRDIPTDLVLAIIQHESGGRAGAISSATTKPWSIQRVDGSTIEYNHSLGLMQCVPRTIADYNARHPEQPVFYEDMLGNDERASRLQIRMGSEVYARAVNALYRYDPRLFPAPTPGRASREQLVLALVAYAVGFDALREKLDELRAKGLPLTFASLARTFPNWGRSETGEWINRPIYYASTVWDRFQRKGEPGKPSHLVPHNPRALPELAAKKREKSPDIVVPLLLLVAAFFFDARLQKPLESLLRSRST